MAMNRYNGDMKDDGSVLGSGARTWVTGGCEEGTLTFVALRLLSASEIGREFSER